MATSLRRCAPSSRCGFDACTASPWRNEGCIPSAASTGRQSVVVLQGQPYKACKTLHIGLWRKAASGKQAGRCSKPRQNTFRVSAIATRLQDAPAEPFEAPAAAKQTGTPQLIDDNKPFSWRKFWFPVHLIADLDVAKPTAVTLLNIDMVVWRDQDGKWAALLDKCPHRLAPLSEGRLEGGNLQCAYHGWDFDRTGACVANPHADGPDAQAKACSDRRARCQSFPTREAHGLLWVWPETGADAWLEASTHALPDNPELLDPEWVGHDGPFGGSDQPINWDIMVENSMDPVHAPFVHHGLVGKREDYRPLHAKLVKAHKDPNAGFEVEHDGYTQSQKDDEFRGTRRFTPNTVRVEYKYKSGRVDLYVIHFVPTKPGWTRGFLKVVYKNPPPFVKRFASFPDWLLHSMSMTIPDQDVLILHKQDRTLRTSSAGARAYFVPNECDGGVIAFRNWLRDKAGGDIGWAKGVTSADCGPELPRSKLLDRYNRHSKNCRVCLQALAVIDRVRLALSVGSAALFLLGVTLVAARRTTAAWVGAFVTASIMLGLKEVLRKFRRNYVTGSSPSEIEQGRA